MKPRKGEGGYVSYLFRVEPFCFFDLAYVIGDFFHEDKVPKWIYDPDCHGDYA
jgi:hypothetical protein